MVAVAAVWPVGSAFGSRHAVNQAQVVLFTAAGQGTALVREE